uniref:AlNc14C12G1445 protein n=1 Tax=Albugo laibachii Nc14 TaxID=890382 RepID=F0W368_9STRA|nr:AlNc14C12G1445 [Albugo laibachii Nc14]|eukprot:CCA15508.1 AlNc14C12G1445 [Albugo laibachii Nc14]
MSSATTEQRNARDVRVNRRHSNPNGNSSTLRKRVSVKKIGPKRTNLIGASNVMLSTRFASLGNESVNEKRSVVSKRVISKKNAVFVSKGGKTKLNNTPSMKTKAPKRTPNNQSIPKFQQQKIKLMAQKNRTKRQEVVNKRRNGLQQVHLNKTKPGGKQPVVAATGKKSKSKTSGSVNRNKEKKASSVGKKKIVNGDQLDVEMDAYWHEGGKGPDPKAAQLDRQMEQYWAKKSDAQKQEVNENGQA